jgi:hypothetical protein
MNDTIQFGIIWYGCMLAFALSVMLILIASENKNNKDDKNKKK